MPNHLATRTRTVVCLAALASVGASHARGQAGTLRGTITGADGLRLPNSEVRVMSENRVTRTDSTGAFALRQLQAGVVEVTIRHLGYQFKVIHVALNPGADDSMAVALTPEPILLASVEIAGGHSTEGDNHPFFVEFERRRALGLGTFIMRDQIVAGNTSYPSDAFRMIAGIRLVRTSSGTGVRFVSTVGTGRRNDVCAPMIWVDGQRVPGMELDELRAQDIRAIEIYRGASTIPQQFMANGQTQCGAIVVWTMRR
jgi:carboxypeptidase family protein